MIRYRFRYQKTDALRYISHLDLQKVWIRILLRAKLPVAYTQGFHPSPKMGSAWPLPLGWEGQNEMIDFWFELSQDPTELVDSDQLIANLNRQSPAGLRVKDAEVIPIHGPSLTAAIVSADYSIHFLRPFPEQRLSESIESLLKRETIERQRRNKRFDMRPWIEILSQDLDSQGNPILRTRMAARDSEMGRPDELIDELGLGTLPVRYIRERFYLNEDIIK